jgi:hypothetical protein
MRTALLVSLAYAGLACAAPDELEDSYKALKEAEGKKNPDLLKKSALETSKLAREVIASKQPADADEVETWKGRVEFAKGVDKYTEYALSVGALEPIEPAKAVDLVETLLTQNPKSEYIAQCSGAYLVALGKLGAEQQVAGATKLIAILPNNEEVLYILVNGTRRTPDRALAYATRLQTVPRHQSQAGGNFRRGLASQENRDAGHRELRRRDYSGREEDVDGLRSQPARRTLFCQQGSAVVGGSIFLLGPG